jgi:hypothetical protein
MVSPQPPVPAPALRHLLHICSSQFPPPAGRVSLRAVNSPRCQVIREDTTESEARLGVDEASEALALVQRLRGAKKLSIQEKEHLGVI